jgi:hypothetical protein
MRLSNFNHLYQETLSLVLKNSVNDNPKIDDKTAAYETIDVAVEEFSEKIKEESQSNPEEVTTLFDLEGIEFSISLISLRKDYAFEGWSKMDWEFIEETYDSNPLYGIDITVNGINSQAINQLLADSNLPYIDIENSKSSLIKYVKRHFIRPATAENWMDDLMPGTSSPLGATDLNTDTVDNNILFIGASAIEQIINLSQYGEVDVIDFNPDQIKVLQHQIDNPEIMALRMIHRIMNQEWDMLTHNGYSRPAIRETPHTMDLLVAQNQNYVDNETDIRTPENLFATDFFYELFNGEDYLFDFLLSFPISYLHQTAQFSEQMLDRGSPIDLQKIYIGRGYDYLDEVTYEDRIEFMVERFSEVFNPEHFDQFLDEMAKINGLEEDSIEQIKEIYSFYQIALESASKVNILPNADVTKHNITMKPKYDHIIMPDLGPSLRNYEILNGLTSSLNEGGTLILAEVGKAFNFITDIEIIVGRNRLSGKVPRQHETWREAMQQYLVQHSIPLQVQTHDSINNKVDYSMDVGEWATAIQTSTKSLYAPRFASSVVRFDLVKS